MAAAHQADAAGQGAVPQQRRLQKDSQSRQTDGNKEEGEQLPCFESVNSPRCCAGCMLLWYEQQVMLNFFSVQGDAAGGD